MLAVAKVSNRKARKREQGGSHDKQSAEQRTDRKNEETSGSVGGGMAEGVAGMLIKEKEHTRARDALAAARRRMPWLAVEKEYVFESLQREGLTL